MEKLRGSANVAIRKAQPRERVRYQQDGSPTSKEGGAPNAEGHVEISAIDPVASMQAVQNPKLRTIAEQVQAKLKAVIDSL
jgi:hypothetical protein